MNGKSLSPYEDALRVSFSFTSRKVCVSFLFAFRLPGRRSARSTKRSEQILEINLKGIAEYPGSVQQNLDLWQVKTVNKATENHWEKVTGLSNEIPMWDGKNGSKQHTGLASIKKVETNKGTTIPAVNNWPAELGANDTKLMSVKKQKWKKKQRNWPVWNRRTCWNKLLV